MKKLPSHESLNFKWIFENIPVYWIYSIFGFCVAVFVAGFTVGQTLNNRLDADILKKLKLKEELDHQVNELQARSSNIKVEILLLENEIKHKSKSISEIRDNLKNNSIRNH